MHSMIHDDLLSEFIEISLHAFEPIYVYVHNCMHITTHMHVRIYFMHTQHTRKRAHTHTQHTRARMCTHLFNIRGPLVVIPKEQVQCSQILLTVIDHSPNVLNLHNKNRQTGTTLQRTPCPIVFKSYSHTRCLPPAVTMCVYGLPPCMGMPASYISSNEGTVETVGSLHNTVYTHTEQLLAHCRGWTSSDTRHC